MKRFFIIANHTKPGTLEAEKKLSGIILGNGGEVVKEAARAECLLTLGGDGTIIQTARTYGKLGKPILGINMGTLGFLAEVSPEDMEEAVKRLLSDDYFVEERMALSGKVMRDGQEIYRDFGLNDIVLHSSGASRAISFDIYVNGGYLTRYFADGIIVASPTGSTAYNLSAGGPIVMPSGETMLLTPVNPHTLLARSVILPPDVTVSLILTGKEGETAGASFDGTTFEPLSTGDELCVFRANVKVKLLKLHTDSFIEVLRKKLGNG